VTIAEDAPALEGKLGDFNVRLEGTTLSATPLVDFSSEETARAAMEPLLADWEVEWDLRHGLGMAFSFESCSLEPVGGSGGKNFKVHVAGTVNVSASMSVSRSDFPPLPSALKSTPLIRELRARLHDVRDERERLLVGAQWILTRLEGHYGGRAAAAKALSVSGKALDELGRQCDRNDPEIGRKARRPPDPLSPEEKGWVLYAVIALVIRAAEVEAGLQQLGTLTKDTLHLYTGTRAP